MVERILNAGARVFAEAGYTAATTNRIASAAGVSIGSLYQYFPDKDAIVTELVRRHIDDGVREIGTRLASPNLQARTLAEQTRVFVEVTVAIHRDEPALHRVLFEEAPRTPEALAALRTFERDTVAAVETLLANDPQVHVRDIPLAAYMTVTAIESITHKYVSSHPEGIDAEALVDELTMLVVSYLGSGRV
jgi:AcrR family transcriptional regulator